ncbi:hypothetical protein BM1_09080 [Bipolaris maydis]|nr:hypothetical protein BM1_09080 [Bipolaris maydis]
MAFTRASWTRADLKFYGIYILLHCITIFLRFIMLVPTIYQQNYATLHNREISDNLLLHNGTYDPNIVTGERLANWWASFAFLWNLTIWVPSIWLHPPLHLPVVVGDVLITVYIARVVDYQNGYVPTEKSACNDMSTFYNQRPPGTNESFFAAAARLNATATTPTKLCKSFVEERQYGISVVFFHALVALSGIVTFVGCISIAREQLIEFVKTMKACAVFFLACIIYLPKGIVELIPFILHTIPVFTFRICLPNRTKAQVRTARRYAVKTALGAEQKTEIALKGLKAQFVSKNNVGGYHGTDGEPTQLAQFLGIYDMLMMVTQHLHYIDVLSLSSVSKSVHNSVLPHDDLHRRLTVFKRNTCRDGGVMNPCSVCWIPMCSDCAKFTSFVQSVPLHHLENCIPYCKTCYYQHIAVKQTLHGTRHKGIQCECVPDPPWLYTMYKRLLNPRTYKGPIQDLREVSVSVCNNCIRLSVKEIKAKRTARAKVMLMKGQSVQGHEWDMCMRPFCERPLSAGPRFWICSRQGCHKECTSSLHQAWGEATQEVGIAV